MTTFINDHGIWANIKLWKDCIDQNIRVKVQESNDRQRKRLASKQSKEDNSSNAKPKGGLFGKGIGKIKNLIQSKESKFAEDMNKN